MAVIDIPRLILVLIVVLAIIFALLAAYATLTKGTIHGGERSKLEARVVRILEDITHHSFDQAHPKWLHEPGRHTPLELDGYNEELKIALEVQGPGHIKPLPGETYEKYQKRVARDRLKRVLCAEHGVRLLTMDYRISLASVRAYLCSRLYDIGTINERPMNYIKELDMIPWQRRVVGQSPTGAPITPQA